MLFLKVIILAVIEGLTEFLPISSTGHLILAGEFLSLEETKRFVDAFLVIIQLPAILAVVVYFWDTLWPFGRSSGERNQRMVLWTKVVVGFIPAMILGFLFGDIIEELLFNPTTVSVALILGGIAFIALETRGLPGRLESVHDIGYARAFFIGLIQCLAMVPGTSRSGASIFGAMALGAKRPAAAEFSFFLAIPTMLGATAYTMTKMGFAFTPNQWAALALGSAVSFAVAYGVIAFLMHYVKRHSFAVFGYYRIVLGVAMLVYFYLFLNLAG